MTVLNRFLILGRQSSAQIFLVNLQHCFLHEVFDSNRAATFHVKNIVLVGKLRLKQKRLIRKEARMEKKKEGKGRS